jgi:hypothetical protein
VVVTNTNNSVNGSKTAKATSDRAEIEVNLLANAAATPVISEQPQGASYTLGDTASPLSVTATVTDGGNLAYQWYQVANNTDTGTDISGATDASYTPSTATEGTVYYYVVVTNTNNSVNGSKTAEATSNRAEIEVNLTVNTATPVINEQPQDASYTLGDTASPLSVTATVTDGGNLAYQWYQAANNTDTGTDISGATDASYTPSTATEGTVYYYVVVTNINYSVSGTPTAEATSNRAAVTVTYSGLSVIFDGLPQDETITLTGTASLLSWRANTAITFTVTGSFSSYAWDVDGQSVSVSTATLTLHAQDYSKGTHTVTAKVTKDGKTWSKRAKFSIGQ